MLVSCGNFVLLSTNSSKRTTNTDIAAVFRHPGVIPLMLGVTLTINTFPKLSWLQTEPLGTGSTILGTNTRVTPVHVGVSIILIVENSQIINTFIGLCRPLPCLLILISRTQPLGTGTPWLQTFTLIAPVCTNITVTNFVRCSSYIFALLQHWNRIVLTLQHLTSNYPYSHSCPFIAEVNANTAKHRSSFILTTINNEWVAESWNVVDDELNIICSPPTVPVSSLLIRTQQYNAPPSPALHRPLLAYMYGHTSGEFSCQYLGNLNYLMIQYRSYVFKYVSYQY